MDYAHIQTEKEIKKLEKVMKQEYQKAYKQASERFKERMKEFDAKDREQIKKVVDESTRKEYINWRKTEVLVNKRYKEMTESLAEDFHNANKHARDVINDKLPDIYALNHNYSTYQIERQTKVNTNYLLYNRDAVNNMMKKKAGLYKTAGLKAARDITWNNRKINSVITQGILQGKPIPKIAKDLQKVSGMNYSSAVRNARTLMNNAQNSGRLDSYRRARDMGIDIEKQWMSTIDDRTRHTHALLDGEIVDIEETFSNGLMEPCDPSGPDEEIQNCRCTMNSVIDGEPIPLDARYMSVDDYDAWKAGHRHALEEMLGL